MSVFSYEWKKLMILRRGLFYMLAALLVSAVWLAAADQPQNSAMETYRAEYEWYLDQLDGAYTEEKAAWLEQEAQAITQARSTRARLQEHYYSGQITAEQYEQQIAEINAVLAHAHGFELAYQQYLYICENTSNRYFLNTNGWAGLFAAQTLDFPLLLVILTLASTTFCSEYSSQMDTLLQTAPQSRKSARCKVGITLCAVFVLCGGLALLRFVFFALNYGLPHGAYPFQSAACFGGSTKNLSLQEAYLLMTALRCFGSVYLAALLLFASVLVKNYALTVVTGAASTLIPYLGLSKQICCCFPLPLPFLLATGFLEGSASAEDPLTGADIVTFSERSLGELLVLLLLSAVCCALMVRRVLRKHTNCWQSGRKSARRWAAAVLGLLLLFPVSGCSGGGCAGVVFNSSSQPVSELDQDLLLSPLFGAFSEGEAIQAVYTDAPYVYCLTLRTEQYVDRVGSYNSTLTQASILQLNTESLEEQVIFEKTTDSGRSLLGIDYTVGDTWMFLQDCRGFFLNEDSLFFITNDGIMEVGRTVQRTQLLDIPTSGNLAFDGRTIYFINEDSLLTAYDTKTHAAAPFRNVVACGFCLSDQGLYFINRMDSNCVYRCGKDGAGCLKISKDPALSIAYHGKELTMRLKADGREVVLAP